MITTMKKHAYCFIKRLQGSQYNHIMSELKTYEFQPFSVLEERRNSYLQALLHAACNWVPFYYLRLEEAGIIDRNGFDSACWDRIPPLTRKDVLHHNKELLHLHHRERGAFYTSTGGSTASPVFIAHDRHNKDWILATYFYINEWAGLTFGSPYFLLWASEQDLAPQRQSLSKWFLMGFLQGRRIMDTTTTDDAVHARHIDMINMQIDCHHLVGYANDIYDLACFSMDYPRPVQRPLKGIFTTASTLTPVMRETIENVFQCKVLNRYGCREAGEIACECPYGNGLHINPLSVKIDVVDDNYQPVPYGTEGRILLTCLHNYSMPLIRYDIGDMGVMKGPEPCPCGRNWESLVQLTGRTVEKICLPDGRQFNGIFAEEAFDYIPHLRKFQIHQVAPDKLVIKVCSPIQQFVEQYAMELADAADKLRAWAGYPLDISFEQSDRLEKTPTGKELTIVSKIRQPLSSPFFQESSLVRSPS